MEENTKEKIVVAALFFLTPFVARNALAGALLGCDIGIITYSSEALTTINQRLGNSVPYTVNKEFGRATNYSLRAGYTDTSEKIRVLLTFEQSKESISGSATQSIQKIEGSGTLSNLLVLPTFSYRLYPSAMKSFGDYQLKRQIQRFYVVSLFYLGILSEAHSFSLNLEEEATKIDYSFSTLHVAYGMGAEIGWRFWDTMDFYLLSDVIYTKSLQATSKVNDFIIKGADYNGGSDPAGLRELASTGLRFIRIGMGIEFRIRGSGNATSSYPYKTRSRR